MKTLINIVQGSITDNLRRVLGEVASHVEAFVNITAVDPENKDKASSKATPSAHQIGAVAIVGKAATVPGVRRAAVLILARALHIFKDAANLKAFREGKVPEGRIPAETIEKAELEFVFPADFDLAAESLIKAADKGKGSTVDTFRVTGKDGDKIVSLILRLSVGSDEALANVAAVTDYFERHGFKVVNESKVERENKAMTTALKAVSDAKDAGERKAAFQVLRSVAPDLFDADADATPKAATPTGKR